MLEQVHDALWVAEGEIVSFFGVPYRTRSVIVRLPNAHLWVRDAASPLRDDRQYPVHPRRRPRTYGRKEPLHIHAEANRAPRQRIGMQVVCHAISLLDQSAS
jgi:hypothetical protein